METGVHARLWPSIGDVPRERHWCQLLLQHDPYHFRARRGQLGTGKLSMAPTPSISVKGLDGASLTIFASVRQLRGAFTAEALPGSVSRPRAKKKWAKDLSCIISEAEWQERWLALHKVPTSGRVRSFLWRLVHRRLPLLGYPHVAQHYNHDDICPLCSSDRETAIHCFSDCDFTDHLWKPVEDVATGISIHLPPGLQSRVIGVTPWVALCQSSSYRPPISARGLQPTFFFFFFLDNFWCVHHSVRYYRREGTGFRLHGSPRAPCL
jgi:hypothetical protein